MNARDMIDDLVDDDGYATYCFIYKSIGMDEYTLSQHEFTNDCGVSVFFEIISSGFLSGQDILKNILAELSSAVTENEKVFLALKYKLTI